MRKSLIAIAVTALLSLGTAGAAQALGTAPANSLSVKRAVVPLTAMCVRTPALAAAQKAHPNASLKRLCAKFGRPLPAGVTRPRVTSLCGNVGCAYIWLYNNGGGWGYAEYAAMPYAGYTVWYGHTYFTRYTKSNNSYANWDDSVEDNDAGGWYGYRYIYPISGTSNSWVNVSMQGWCVLYGGIEASIGPVNTWNYITH